MGTRATLLSSHDDVSSQCSRLALRKLRCLTLLAPLALPGCWWIPSIPSTPHVQQEFLTVPEKLPASVAVVVEDSFTETRYERVDYTAKGQRFRSGDVKVKIGESSLRLLELTLPSLFETVVFVDAKDKAGGTDFVLYPRILRFSREERGLTTNAEIDYEFEFVRGSDSETVEVFRPWGSGKHTASLGLRLAFMPVWLPIMLATFQFGTWDARIVAAAFSAAQEAAVAKFVASLPQSKVAAEARRLKDGS